MLPLLSFTVPVDQASGLSHYLFPPQNTPFIHIHIYASSVLLNYTRA